MIDCQSPPQVAPTEKAAPSRTILETVAALSHPHHKKTFIYTSGLLTVADSEDLQDENYVAGNPPQAWRREWERELLSNTRVNAIALSPGYVAIRLSPSYFFESHPIILLQIRVWLRGRTLCRWADLQRAG